MTDRVLYGRKEEDLPHLGGDLITAQEAIVSCRHHDHIHNHDHHDHHHNHEHGYYHYHRHHHNKIMLSSTSRIIFTV